MESLKAFCCCLVSFGNLFMLWSDIRMAKLAKNFHWRKYFLQRCYASAKRNIFRYHCYGFVIRKCFNNNFTDDCGSFNFRFSSQNFNFFQLKILTQNECKNLWEPFKDNCSSQETDLTTAYTYACVVFALVGVPVGAIFDKFGTMATRLIGASLFLFGNILVLSAQNNHR